MNDKNRLTEELRSLKPDYEKMKNKLADAKQNLEDETLKRIDLQTQLQTQQEEAKFKNHMLEQQINETRMRKQIEIEEIDGAVQETAGQFARAEGYVRAADVREQVRLQCRVR